MPQLESASTFTGLPLSHFIMGKGGIIEPNFVDAERMLARYAGWRGTEFRDADPTEPLRVEFRRLGDKYLAPVVWAMVRGLNWISRKLS